MDKHKVTREDLRRLARERVLTTKEFARILHRSARQAAKLAFDLQKRGMLTHVRRGVYASVPLEVDPQGFQPDPFVAAYRALGREYAFSHQSALSLHGLEQTIRATLDMSAPGVRSRTRKVGSFRVRLHSTPRNRWKGATMTVRRGGVSLTVTTPERTLVDFAALPNSAQDYPEAVLAFRSLLPRVDPRRLLREVRRTPHASTRARVGHLLQASGASDSLTSRVVRTIAESGAHVGPAYFATRPRATSNRFDSRFQLVYPGGN
jgi:predicted transcriptional regulator of viral defense system